ncbi:MAG: DUF1553 domain-containing protein [Proteobacteria bacterium]|nr:DUF1553 domain-containing protein [Pseudomonadota bacterium]
MKPGMDSQPHSPRPAGQPPRPCPRFAFRLRAPAVCVVLACLTLSTLLAAEKVESEAKAAPLQPIVVGKPLRLEVHPSTITLGSPQQRAQVVVTGVYADGSVQDLTRAATYTLSDAKLASVAGGWVAPLREGKTELLVKAGGREARLPVTVASLATPETVSFKYGALAALSKQGCNSGGCHGAPSGKGGFALSLGAFDPEVDKVSLVFEYFNRRVDVLDPEASLLLRKPLMEVGHRGGLRLRTNDVAYTALTGWIRQGCRFDREDAPHCTGIAVYPPTGRVLKWPAHTQQLQVLAKFSDGSTRDITRLAVYASSDEALASVTPEGLAIGTGERGQVAVSVRYLEHVEACYLTLTKDVPGFRWAAPAERNYVDRLVNAKLQQLRFLPAETCTDGEFIRRVHLDVIGILPSPEETRKFLGDTAPDKRSKLIDALLDRPEYARFWALKWGDLLRLNAQQVTAGGVHKYHRWLVSAFAENQPYDAFARELLTAQGSTFEHPAANFYRTTQTTTDTLETTAQIFLGARLQCAKCHNHPYERWTQDNYYGMGAIFERVKRKTTARTGEQLIYTARHGEITQPRTGKEMKPWAPGAGQLADSDDTDRREVFAAWLTQPDNPYFARVEANRIWSHLMGQGIVEPVDDFRDSNPPSNVELLAALAKDFATHRFDRKHLLRTILNSSTYQASSRASHFNEDDTRNFSRARQRLLTAEQMLDAVCHVTGMTERFGNLPAGTMATQLPAPEPGNAFLGVFGQPQRTTACACERPSAPQLAQALQLFNGPLIHGKLQAKDNRLRRSLAAGKSDPEIITELYLAALCRPPKPEELARATKHITGNADRERALEDIAWALLNVNEFLFQH